MGTLWGTMMGTGMGADMPWHERLSSVGSFFGGMAMAPAIASLFEFVLRAAAKYGEQTVGSVCMHDGACVCRAPTSCAE